MSPDVVSTRPLLDKLGVKPGAKVAVLELDDPPFLKLLRERTSDITAGKPRILCDIVFMGAREPRDLKRLREVKSWIEPNGAIWVIRPKGTPDIKEVDVIDAGKRAGLVDNKIASFSDTLSAMRLVIPVVRR